MSNPDTVNPAATSPAGGEERRPQKREIGPCYHCDVKSNSNTYCDTWRVWTCGKCLAKHHRDHHKSCLVDIPKGHLVEKKQRNFFTISVTRFDGRPFPLHCRLGDKLEMEDHWMGTYIFGRGGMILVTESRNEINDKILFGLKTVK